VTVEAAIDAAERILPGQVAPEGDKDPRWQAIIAVSEFIRTDRDAVWRFIEKWGCHPDDDLRAAISTCLLEHFLECHFEDYIARVEQLALANPHFADTVSGCWAFGRTELRKNRRRFENLKRRIRNKVEADE
jgi:hypothetical protein